MKYFRTFALRKRRKQARPGGQCRPVLAAGRDAWR